MYSEPCLTPAYSESWLLKTLAYVEPEAYAEPWHIQNRGISRTLRYSEPCQTSMMEHCTKIVNRELFSQIIIIFAISAFHILYFLKFNNPVDKGHKLNVCKMFRRHLGSILNVLRTFNLCPVSTRKGELLAPKVFIICKKA